ncbi:MAG: HtrL protein family-containing protein [Barrevirus sp.]|uniref:HtrL protein family-containing protein n=1 Tax=Barrevirus sp. TaxID=2487763 RepID=A0A3G4ZQK4_9VIRU|nr:MAG: HtrL protein family-containing protein [Barrevirus sp.]
MSQIPEVCYVTAYTEIGRDKWKHYERTFGHYKSYFSHYLKFDVDMIIYIDERYYDEMTIMLQNKPKFKLIKINDDFLKKNIFAWSLIDREREIMKSESYQSIIKHRLKHPENTIPEYNITVHSKIDFVNYTIDNKLSPAKFYAWTDFGYFKYIENVPEKPININKFDKTKLTFSTVNPIEPSDKDIIFTLTYAPSRIDGGFFFGSIAIMKQFQKMYHDVLIYFQKNNFADDDQHIVLQCYFRNPSLFKLYVAEWSRAWLIHSQ